LDECAKKYKGFCQRYTPKKKKQTVNTWGSKLYRHIQRSKSPKPVPVGQMALPFAYRSPLTAIIHPDINGVTLPFIKANRPIA
jgi:putative transposase